MILFLKSVRKKSHQFERDPSIPWAMTIGAKSDLTFFEENSSKLSLTFWVELTEKFKLDWRDKFLTVRQQRLWVCFTPNIVIRKKIENLCIQVIKFLFYLFKKHWIILIYSTLCTSECFESSIFRVLWQSFGGQTQTYTNFLP